MRLDRLVEEQWLADVFYFRNSAFEIECLGKDDLEYLRNSKNKLWTEGENCGLLSAH